MNIIRNYRNWRRERETISELNRLSNRELADLAVQVLGAHSHVGLAPNLHPDLESQRAARHLWRLAHKEEEPPLVPRRSRRRRLAMSANQPRRF